MGLIIRKRVNVKGVAVNVSKNGLSLSKRLGRMVTVNSRGQVTVRLFPGVSFRFKVR